MHKCSLTHHQDPIQLESLGQCPLCGNKLIKDAEIKVKDPFFVAKDTFSIDKCKSCKSWILNPRPKLTDMGVFYEEDFLAQPVTDHKPGLLDKLASLQQNFNLISEKRWINKNLKGVLNYLDVSAGNGQIAKYVSSQLKRDKQVYVTEFSHVYLQNLKSFFNEEHCKKDVSEFENNKFDLITAFGVFEHLDNPIDFLNVVKTKISSDGKLLLSVPNPESWQANFLKESWYSWLAPRHWQLGNRKYLKHLFEEHGFSVISEKHFFFRTCSATLVLSMFPKLDPLVNPTKMGLILYALLFYTFLPLEYFSSLFKSSGFMGFTLKKKT